jgi:hypothetical protein
MPPLPPQPSSTEFQPERDSLAQGGELHHAIHRLCEFADVNPQPRRRRRLVAFSGVATLWVEAAALVVAQSVGLS